MELCGDSVPRRHPRRARPRIHRDAVEPVPKVLRRMTARFAASLTREPGEIERSLAGSAGVWLFGAEVGPEWRQGRRAHLCRDPDGRAALEDRREGDGSEG